MTRLRATLFLLAAFTVACAGSSSQVVRESILQPDEGASAPTAGSQPSTGREGAETGAAGGEGAVVAAVAPARAEELAAQGLANLRAGRLEEGRASLVSAVGTGYAGAVVYYNLALAQLRLGDIGAALENAQAAVEMSRGKPKAVYLYGRLTLSSGRASTLLSVMQKIAADNPDSMAAKIMMARAKIAMGRAAEGLRDASQLLKKDQTGIEIMKTIANAYLAMKRQEAAKLVLKQTLELKRDAGVLDMLGQLAVHDGDRRTAIAYFQEAAGLDPTLADVHNNLGVLFHEAGDYESAIREFESALAIMPSYSIAHMNMGNAYRKMLKYPQAENAYRAALRINPDCADCYFNLGVNSLENKGAGKDEPGHYRKAIEHFTRYKDLLRGPPRRGDEAEKYLDEARRMADYLEKEAQMKEAPEEDSFGEGVETSPSNTEGTQDDEGTAPVEEGEEEWVD